VSAFLLVAALTIGALIVLALHRVVVGPTAFDRVIASALVAANGMVLLLLVSLIFGRLDMFVDIAISYALLAFVLPIALGKYYEQRRQR
jgi:multicomponent Na+:H+ antiporter subunit F